jgi:hypothetical protein
MISSSPEDGANEMKGFRQMTPLKYLMAELGLKAGDWGKLSDKDKEGLKRYAKEEMEYKGLL